MQSERRVKALFLAGLFLVCMCGLMLQIMETRLLSVIAWYYLAFFAISMAMFGMTAGSLFVYFVSRLFPPDRLLEQLSWIASAMAVAILFSTISLVSSVVLGGLSSGMMALLWLKLILNILPPYVFAGMAISLALTRSPWLRLLAECRRKLRRQADMATLGMWQLLRDRRSLGASSHPSRRPTHPHVHFSRPETLTRSSPSLESWQRVLHGIQWRPFRC